MNNDLVSMLANLSHSLASIQLFITAFGYILGLVFSIVAIMKFKQNIESHSQEGMYSAGMYLVAGIGLIFLPSMVTILSSTAFGTYSILQYTSYNPYDIYASMGILLRTAGLIWFVRGCALLVHSGGQGSELAPKGLAFIAGGILAINFQYSLAAINYMMSTLAKWTGFG